MPKWSQNFLKDSNIARKIVRALKVHPQDSILEIGPGKGALTHFLLEQGASVTAVEIDPELAKNLKTKYANQPRLKIIQKDFLDFNISPTSHPYKIIGNLPYAVTSPILQKILSQNNWQKAIIMIQREVAERILASSGKKMGILSLSVQLRANVKKEFSVGKNCFNPIPQVESSVLSLFPLTPPKLPSSKWDSFFYIIKAAFAHRRKKILNSMSQSLNIPTQQIQDYLEKAQISHKMRAEQLSLDQFCHLAEIWKHHDS